jgi:four helix bundle protein
MSGVSRYEDLIVWRIANELQCGVFELTATGRPASDVKFRDQVRDSSASVTRNIAEGFGRFADGEFAWFLRVARGSLMETHNSLRDGQDRGYFTSIECSRSQRLALRAVKAASGLICYLDPPDGRKRRARGGRRPPVDPVDPWTSYVLSKALTSSTTCCGVSIIRLCPPGSALPVTFVPRSFQIASTS